ncbi:MAG: hypothetical protein AB7T48_11120 [Solirubrobacterales bacterium]
MFGLREKQISSKLDELVALQQDQRKETSVALGETKSALEETKSALGETKSALEETKSALGESRSALEETRAAVRELRAGLEEFREFNREILLRNEKVYFTVIARLEELGEEVRANTEETRAQTKALLSLIDRFEERGGTAAA